VRSVTEESYTSKANFLDLDSIAVYDSEEPKKEHEFSGKRVKRSLYSASSRWYINADVNAAYHVIRKCEPDVFKTKGVAGYIVHPVRLPHKSNEKAECNEALSSFGTIIYWHSLAYRCKSYQAFQKSLRALPQIKIPLANPLFMLGRQVETRSKLY
jgi:hypothetical protein